MSQSQRALTKSTLRVRRQLMEAILFEQLIPYNEKPLSDDNEFVYQLGDRNRMFQCIGKRMSFDRIRLHDDIYMVGEDRSIRPTTIEDIVEELTADSSVKNQLMYELEQTIQLSDWTEKHVDIPKSRRHLSYEQLESSITEGHLYHPCYKARSGFSLSDHQAFGPEGKRPFKLYWAAARRKDVQLCFPQDESLFWEEELGSSLYHHLSQTLLSLGGNLKEYTFVPIHPWQWKELQMIGIQPLIERNELLLLGRCGDDYSATQSVRTLWNVDNLKKAYMKLPMNMINTSSLRTLAPHTVCAAPLLSDWLQSIVFSDTFLQKECRLVLLKEYASVAFERNDHPELNGQIGAIWRESVHLYLESDEKAVPFTALMMTEQDGRLFVDEWLKEYGTERWIKRFLEVAVLPVWHLLVAHGIGIEAHAQNMILFHEDGWPMRIALRDFHESVEYVHDYVVRTDLVPNFREIHPRFQNGCDDEYYWMSSIEALRELVMDTLFVFHLSEVSYALEEHGLFCEHKFWSLVREIIEKHIGRFSHLKERHAMLHPSQPKIFVESLLRNKIQKGHHRHIVTNALAIESQ
ncbi:Aerobactin synthase IucC [Anoxybacillus ayderensis]|uniref:Aerobactin synthase IucC n=1 Tax=Anoxybacillus ayderensis TaxID=265546 RepID=A0A0D0HUH2_9BACL|nr:IucA/IucC family protein [Anoxybacillus ayderensis]KIP21463.1 Aerobactin synthase IucC [Anoxybacillus ayderensis]